MTKRNCKGLFPESWCCVDCGINTAPGCRNRVTMERAFKAAAVIEKLTGEKAGVQETITHDSEIYLVHRPVWKAAGMEPFGGCLCIGCLEKRLGRRLQPKDFPRRHPLNRPYLPCTPRLRRRRTS